MKIKFQKIALGLSIALSVLFVACKASPRTRLSPDAKAAKQALASAVASIPTKTTAFNQWNPPATSNGVTIKKEIVGALHDEGIKAVAYKIVASKGRESKEHTVEKASSTLFQYGSKLTPEEVLIFAMQLFSDCAQNNFDAHTNLFSILKKSYHQKTDINQPAIFDKRYRDELKNKVNSKQSGSNKHKTGICYHNTLRALLENDENNFIDWPASN